MDPLLDEVLAADRVAAEVAERLAELARLLLIGGGRLRARGRAEGFDDFDPMHTTAERLRRDVERLRARLGPFVAEARRMECAETA